MAETPEGLQHNRGSQSDSEPGVSVVRAHAGPASKGVNTAALQGTHNAAVCAHSSALNAVSFQRLQYTMPATPIKHFSPQGLEASRRLTCQLVSDPVLEGLTSSPLTRSCTSSFMGGWSVLTTSAPAARASFR